MSNFIKNNNLLLSSTGNRPPDPDAISYIINVMNADQQFLESSIQMAINDFVVGCKWDNIWSSIKSCCILAGPHTLAGALVPLVGAAPINVNFQSSDYNRKTGLKGDGSTKYLNSNRSANADPQNSKHVSVYATQTSTSVGCLIGHRPNDSTDVTQIIDNPGTFTRIKVNGSNTNFAEITGSPTPGFFGGNRNNALSITGRANNTTVSASITSITPTAEKILVFARGKNIITYPDPSLIEVYSDARLSFFSIGESLDLTLLNNHVSTLMATIEANLP